MLNLDTHILLDALAGALPRKEIALLSKHDWSVSSIVLWEITKLVQLKRVDLDLDDPLVIRTLNKIHAWPIDLDICSAIRELDFRSDPADELIAATSLVRKIPLVTRDRKILKSKIVPLAVG
jgi:PIN domain nuclease of toxin-antitoxin system